MRIGQARLEVWAVAVLAVIALAGCGLSSPINPSQVIGNAAKLTTKITQVTQGYLRHWCPQAFEDNARYLTQRKARDCLQRAKTDYLGLLHKHGYDPSKIVNGGG